MTSVCPECHSRFHHEGCLWAPESDRCDTHDWIDADFENCPLCIAEGLFKRYDDNRGYAVEPDIDERDRFAQWIWDAMANNERADCDDMAERLTNRPGELLRQWRRERGPSAERLTVAVRVCMKCRILLGVGPWQGKDAHLGHDYQITDGLCGLCGMDGEGA